MCFSHLFSSFYPYFLQDILSYLSVYSLLRMIIVSTFLYNFYRRVREIKSEKQPEDRVVMKI